MATFCFTDQRPELFTEALARGYLAGLLDFPRFKPVEDRVLPAQAAVEELRAEVCCVKDEVLYANLLRAAWLTGYQSVTQEVERDAVKMAMGYKQLPAGEALHFLRRGFQSEQGRAMVEKIYADCQMALRYFEENPHEYLDQLQHVGG